MKKIFLIIFIVLFFSIIDAKIKVKDLPLKSRLWLTRDVVYIISPTEKDTFLQLKTEHEREKFIEIFWKQRDPNPNTVQNEYKIEHYKRIKYANKHYGKEAPGPGWRSEMGRIHILLGKPQQITSFLNSTGIYPTIIWFYSNLGIRGIPNAFNIVFFRPNVGGEYKLYSPIQDGPAALLTNYRGDRNDYNRAYLELYNIEHEVANISLTLLPDERSQTISPSISSTLLLYSKIPQIPYNSSYDSYAKTFLNFKGTVRINHMENYIKNYSMVNGIYNNEKYGFLHLLIEPKKLTLEKTSSKLYSIIKIYGNIYDENNKNIYKYSKVIPIKLDIDKLSIIQKKAFSFQDMFPLLTGKYRYDFLLMNIAGKEFTSIKGKITIPSKSSKPKITSLIIGNKLIDVSKKKHHLKPFVFNNKQILPSAKNDFNPLDTMFVYTQITGLSKNIIKNMILQYSIINLKTKKTVFKNIKSLNTENNNTDFFKSFSLQKIPAAFYTIKIILMDKTGKTLSQQKTEFYIGIKNILRPWVMSTPISSKKEADAIINNIIGKQFVNLNKFNKSLHHFQKALSLQPSSFEFAINYINNLIKLKKYKTADMALTPLLKTKHRNNFLLLSSKLAFILKKYKKAIASLTEYIKHYGANVEVLNMLGESYIRLGDITAAISSLKQSLKKQPNQPKIKQILNKLENIKNAK